MTSTTVAEFANELKKSPDTLLEQLRSAGVAKSTGADTLSESDKQKLLGYLQASHFIMQLGVLRTLCELKQAVLTSLFDPSLGFQIL